ncbi:hypothetical protein K8T06_00095 [bacterium]|nr:hypothetical protein [bacterium]
MFNQIMKKMLAVMIVSIVFSTFIWAPPAGAENADKTVELHERSLEMYRLYGHPGTASGEPLPAPQVGDQRDFWAYYHQGSAGGAVVPSTCQYVGEHCYIFVEDAMWHEAGGPVTTAKVDTVGLNFDEETPETSINPEKGIYEIVTESFGPAPDSLDNDPKIYILLLEIGGDIQGFFDSTNQYPKSQHENSNEVEMVYVDGTEDTTDNRCLAILSHEFTHMIHWNADPNENLWIDEGCASFAYFLCGWGQDYWIAIFAQNPDNNLTKWSESADYPQTYMFIMYLYEKYGGLTTIHALVAEQENGIEGINATLAAQGFGDSFSDIFTDWVLANELDDPEIPDGEYAYENISLGSYPMARTATVDQYPTELDNEQVNRWAADYIELTDFAQGLDIHFEGDDGAEFVISAIRFVDNNVTSIQRIRVEPIGQSADFQIPVSAADKVVLVISVQDRAQPAPQAPYTLSIGDAATPDESPPFVWRHQPTGIEIHPETPLEITILDDACDVKNVVVTIDGIAINPEITTGTNSVTVSYIPDFGWYGEEFHTITVDCSDAAGNQMETFTYYFTPVPVKDLGIRLMLDDVLLKENDRFYLHFDLWSAEQAMDMDIYILLDTYGLYYAWPSWVSLETGIDSKTFSVLPDELYHHDVLDFIWPAVGGSASGFYFYGASFESGSFDFIGDIQAIRFSYQ